MDDETRTAIANVATLFGGRSRRQQDADDEWLATKLAELFAGQQSLTEALEALARRVKQLADRLDGSSTTRHGSPANETKAEREKRLRDHQLLSRGTMPSSYYRR